MKKQDSASMMVRFFKRMVARSRDESRRMLQDGILERAAELETIITNLEKVAGDAEARRLRRAIATIQEKAALVRELTDGVLHPFLLFVVGMGNYGKSTLINALVGTQVADVDFLPKTWKIDIFSAQRRSAKVLIRTKSGQQRELSAAEARRFLAQEEERRLESEDEIGHRLSQRLPTLKTPEEREELRKSFYEQLLYESEVTEVHWPCPGSELLDRFDIVDTPGVIQKLSEHTRMGVQEYYHKADGVLWMLDARMISGRQSKKMLDELEQALRQIGRRPNNIIGVLNRMDLIAQKDRSAVTREAERIFSRHFLEIVPLSAKQAYDAAVTGNENLLEESGLTALVRAIKERFLSRAVQLQHQSKVTGLKGYVNDAHRETRDYVELLEQHRDKRNDLTTELTLELKVFKERMNARLEGMLTTYEREVRLNIELLAEELFELEKNSARNRFVRQKIFQEHQVKEISKTMTPAIFTEAKQIFSEFYPKCIFSQYRYLKPSTLPAELAVGQLTMPSASVAADDFDTSVGQWVSGIAVGGIAAAILGPVGLVIGALALTGIGKAFIQRLQLSNLKSRFSGELDDVLARIRKEIGKQISGSSREVHSRLTNARDTSFSELHGPANKSHKVVKLLQSIQSVADEPFVQPTVQHLIVGG